MNPNLKFCKKVSDCKCPKLPSNQISSTSCINGVCKCNDKTVAFFAATWMKSVAAIGNAPITKAIGNLMAGISDVKEVLGTILGAFLPPVAKAALKVSYLISFIEQ